MLDWLACGLVRAIGWCLCRLPVRVCLWLGAALGELLYWLQPKRVRIGSMNLRAAFGERLSPAQVNRIVHRVFRHLGMGVIEMLRLPVMDRAYVDRYIKIDGYPHLEAAIASGRPVLLLTGHFGNWELCSITSALIGHPILALARAQNKFPKLYRLLVSYRESKGCRVVHKGGMIPPLAASAKGGPARQRRPSGLAAGGGMMRRLLQALNRRELVGIVGDQVSRQGMPVEFFGRPALFATGPFELARSRRALIVPALIHRVRGPFHRLVIEPPIDLPQHGTREAIVRDGLERFAAVLARHIEADPAQWLWLHQRWKHTSSRRVIIFSDGKLGHLKQSLTVLQAMQERSGDLRHQIVEVRYRHRLGRLAAVAWAWLAPRGWGSMACLRLVLDPACFAKLARAFADVVISCGASPAPVNVLFSAENRAKSVVIMNPTPIPLRRFTLAFVPMHDRLPRRANVIQTWGALTGVSNGRFTPPHGSPACEGGEEGRGDPEGLSQKPRLSTPLQQVVTGSGRGAGFTEARQRLREHPRFQEPAISTTERPVISVFLGGDTREYQVTTGFTESLLHQVLAVCEETNGCCLVTTSRRTPPSVERWLSERLANHPRCRLLLLASRDPLDGTIEGMLGWAKVVVVTGESISMVSEACASGRDVIVVEPPLRRVGQTRLTKPQRYLRLLAEEGAVHSRSLPEVGHAIRRCLSGHPLIRRLDTYATVQDAVGRLL